MTDTTEPLITIGEALTKPRQRYSSRDLAGQRFGRLVAIEPTAERRQACVVWRCQCDCGAVVFKTTQYLNNPRSRLSCGCYFAGHPKHTRESRMAAHRASARSRYKQKDIAAIKAKRIAVERKNVAHAMLLHLRSRAKKFGIECTITEADLVVPEICPVLGFVMVRRGPIRDMSPSVDRIDNTKGYVPGNVVVVSYRANRLKSNATVEELMLVTHFYRRLAGLDQMIWPKKRMAA